MYGCKLWAGQGMGFALLGGCAFGPLGSKCDGTRFVGFFVPVKSMGGLVGYTICPIQGSNSLERA